MRIAFTSNRTGAYDLYLKPSNGSGTEERLVDSPNAKISRRIGQGRPVALVLRGRPHHRPRSVGAGHDRPRPHAACRREHARSKKRWRSSLRTGAGWRIRPTNRAVSRSWCSRFPTRAANGRCRPRGGVAPRWRADGKELYFLAPDATLMAVPVTAAGTAFEAGTPVALFPTRIVGGGSVTEPAAVRGRARRPVPDQPAGGRRHRRADHAASELESRGEAVAAPTRSAPCRPTRPA